MKQRFEFACLALLHLPHHIFAALAARLFEGEFLLRAFFFLRQVQLVPLRDHFKQQTLDMSCFYNHNMKEGAEPLLPGHVFFLADRPPGFIICIIADPHW